MRKSLPASFSIRTDAAHAKPSSRSADRESALHGQDLRRRADRDRRFPPPSRVTVLAAKRLIGRVARMGRAELLRVAPGAEILARLQRRDGERRAEHRDIDMAAFAFEQL